MNDMRHPLLVDADPELARHLVDPALAHVLTAGSNKKVDWWCEGTDERPHPRYEWRVAVAQRSVGYGCKICAKRGVIAGWNDIATTHPEMVTQLVDLSLANTLTAGSNKKVDWWCEGTDERPHPRYEWQASASNRARSVYKCPACAGKIVLPGFNDLATTHPDLAAHLVNARVATAYSAGSRQKVDWWCEGVPERPHRRFEWSAELGSRAINGNGCPVCAGFVILPGFNDLATTHPLLASQLVNQNLATQVGAGSHTRVEWLCGGADGTHPNPRTWWTVPALRTARVAPSGCPDCASSGFKPSALGWIYRFIINDRTPVVCFGKTGDPKRRFREYRSPKYGLGAIYEPEIYLVGTGADATFFEDRLNALMKEHSIPSGGQRGINTHGIIKESFFLADATQEFLVAFGQVWAEVREAAVNQKAA